MDVWNTEIKIAELHCFVQRHLGKCTMIGKCEQRCEGTLSPFEQRPLWEWAEQMSGGFSMCSDTVRGHHGAQITGKKLQDRKSKTQLLKKSFQCCLVCDYSKYFDFTQLIWESSRFWTEHGRMRLYKIHQSEWESENTIFMDTGWFIEKTQF